MPDVASTELPTTLYTTRTVSTTRDTSFYPRVWFQNAYFCAIDAEQLKQWSDVLAVTTKVDKTNTPQSGYTQTIYGDGTAATAQLVGYSAQGVGHTVPQHPDLDIAFFGL